MSPHAADRASDHLFTVMCSLCCPVCVHCFFKLCVYIYIILCIYSWLCWVFTAARVFLQLRRAWALSRTRASVVAAPGLWSADSGDVVHGLGCSTACGIFPYQDSSPCLLHRWADSLPVSRVHFLNLSVSPISKRPLENRNILL